MKKIKSEKKEEKKSKQKKYYESVGRRKTSVARVRIVTINLKSSKEGEFKINNADYKEYFPTMELQHIVRDPLHCLRVGNRFGISVKVYGGGVKSQAGAVRHGIARALVKFDSNFRKKLKKAGFLTRDPRMKERRKYGLKKARRAPQWVKR